MSRRRLFVKTTKDYIDLMDQLAECGADYEKEVYGTTKIIRWKDREWTCIDASRKGGKGYHLCNVIKQDVLKWLEENKDKLDPEFMNYKEQMVNFDGLRKYKDRPIVAIDVNGCYWKTAYNLGFISKDTYIMGNRTPKWKEGRNASIGSLAKTKYVYKYKDGRKVDKRVVKSPRELQWVRNKIIGHVYNMFYELFLEIGDSFLMYLTDCVYVPADKAKYARKHFTQYDYRAKMKTIKITNVDEKNGVVEWEEYSEGKGGEAKIKEKYYIFSDRQKISEQQFKEKYRMERVNNSALK